MNPEIQEKILRYETFINDNLKEDLKRVCYKRNKLSGEISEYIQLKNSIEAIADLDDTFKTKLDLGCSFFMQANVADTSRIFVDVGLGHFVEFTLAEALRFTDHRIKSLTLQTDKLKTDTAKINGTIKLMLGGLAELQNIKNTDTNVRRDL